MHFAFGAMIILTVTSPSAAYQAWRSASFGAPTITLGGKTRLGPRSYIGHSPRAKISPRTDRRSQESRHRMSVKRPKAEVAHTTRDVRYVPKGDISGV
jgi:hypothetical protein